MHVSADGTSFDTIDMTPAGGDLWEATLPPLDCGEERFVYFSFDEASCGLVTDPAGAPGTTHHLVPGVPHAIFHDDGEEDLGWTTATNGATAGLWERAVPLAGGTPPYDQDGSGRCWVTGNQAVWDAVEGGPVELRSPVFDCSAGLPAVTFAYWTYVGAAQEGEALVLEGSDDGGAQWVELARYGHSTVSWIEVRLEPHVLAAAGLAPTADVVFRFSIADHGLPDSVEAGVDAFRLVQVTCASIGTSYCGPANLNSTGGSASLRGIGSTTVADGDLQLVATFLPEHKLGMFLAATEADFVPFPPGTQGNLCLGGGIGRFGSQVAPALEGGWLSITVDLGAVPVPGGTTAVQPGETWRFQCWFRDRNPHATSNLTDGLAITFR